MYKLLPNDLGVQKSKHPQEHPVFYFPWQLAPALTESIQ